MTSVCEPRTLPGESATALLPPVASVCDRRWHRPVFSGAHRDAAARCLGDRAAGRHREKTAQVGLFLFLLLAVIASTGCQNRRAGFYPLGIYAAGPNDLKTVREAGFNLVTGPADKSYLDSAQGLSLKVLASPQTSAGPTFSASAARHAIGAFDSHPALWAWYLIDEPDLNRISPNDVSRAHRFLKSLGAGKPTALVLYQGYNALDYAHLSDILMIDRYPIPWLPLANFPQHVRMARLALGKRAPLVAVIQAFDWSKHPDLLPNEKDLRPPTFDEVRCMTYAALVQRATGLFYYCYDDGRWKMAEHPGVWDDLKRVVNEVNDRLPLFQAEHVWWPYVHRFQDPAIRFNAALESSVTPALLRVRIGNQSVPAGDYILTVNNTGKKHVYGVYLPRPMHGTLPVFGEGRARLIQDNWVDDEFEPYAIHVYGPLPPEIRPPKRSVRNTDSHRSPNILQRH
jgi:hypothetical protein